MVNGLGAIGCQTYPECQQISDPSVTLPLSDPATSSTNFSTTGIASQYRICNKYPPKILLLNICEKFSRTIWHHSLTKLTKPNILKPNMTASNRQASAVSLRGPRGGGLGLLPIPVLKMTFGCNNL